MKDFLNKLKITILLFLSPKEIILLVCLLFFSFSSFVVFTTNLTNLFKTERIVYAGTITEGLIGYPKITNPFQAINQSEKDLAKLLFATLIKKLEGGKFELGIAGKIETTEDKLTYTIYIRDGARFSNGDEIKAADIAYSLQNIPTDKNFTVDIKDSKTVVVNFKNDSSENLKTFTYPILSQAEKFDTTWNEDLITSSSFKIDTIEKDNEGNVTQISLKRFDNGEEKIPYLKKYIIQFYGDETLALTDLQKYKINILSGIPGQVTAKLKEDSKFKINSPLQNNTFALFINQQKNDILKNDTVRSMLSDSLDRENLVNQVLGGYGLPVKNLLDENEKPTPEDKLLKNLPSLLTVENGVLYTTSKSDSSLDTKDKQPESKEEKSKKESKTPVKITLTTINNKELVETAIFVANTWKKLGIDVEVHKIDRKELQSVVKARDFDILLFGFSVNSNSDYYSFFSSKERNYPKLNISNYVNKNVDSIVEDLQNETEPRLLLDLKKNLSKKIDTENPVILLYKPKFIQVVNGDLEIITPPTLSDEEERFREVSNWYTETEKVLKPFVNQNLLSRFSNWLDRVIN